MNQAPYTPMYDPLSAGIYDQIIGNDPLLHGDITFFCDEARKADGTILELGCGTGRVTIPIATTGKHIIGLDLAPAMLEVAEQKRARLPLEVQHRLTFVQGDIRSFDLDQQFALIILPYNVFFHLLTREDHIRTLNAIHAHLRPGGSFIITGFALPPEAQAGMARTLQPHDLRLVSQSSEGGLQHIYRHGYQLEGPLIHQAYHVEIQTPAGQSMQSEGRILTTYNATPKEVQQLFREQNVVIKAAFSDFRRNPLQSYGLQIYVLG